MIQVQTINIGEGITMTAEIDLSALELLEERVQALRSDLAKTVQMLGDTARDEWIKIAESRLRRGGSYVSAVSSGVKYPSDDELTYEISPEFKEVQGGKNIGILMEYGFEAFDMKAKVNEKKKIRFEYGLPTSSEPLKISQGVHDVAKRHNMFRDYPLTKKKAPELFSGYFADENNPKKIKQITIKNPRKERFPLHNINNLQQKLVIENHYWRTRQFAGMKAANSSGTKFSTIRTLSPFAPKDPRKVEQWRNSWLHPGVEPKNIFRDMVASMAPKVKPAIQGVIQEYLS